MSLDLFGDGMMNSRAPLLAGPPIEGGAGRFHGHSIWCCQCVCAETHHE